MNVFTLGYVLIMKFVVIVVITISKGPNERGNGIVFKESALYDHIRLILINIRLTSALTITVEPEGFVHSLYWSDIQYLMWL